MVAVILIRHDLLERFVLKGISDVHGAVQDLYAVVHSQGVSNGRVAYRAAGGGLIAFFRGEQTGHILDIQLSQLVAGAVKSGQRRVCGHVQGRQAAVAADQGRQARKSAHIQRSQIAAGAVKICQTREVFDALQAGSALHLDPCHCGDLVLGEDAAAVGVEVLADIAAERVVGEVGLVDGHTLFGLDADDNGRAFAAAQRIVRFTIVVQPFMDSVFKTVFAVLVSAREILQRSDIQRRNIVPAAVQRSKTRQAGQIQTRQLVVGAAQGCQLRIRAQIQCGQTVAAAVQIYQSSVRAQIQSAETVVAARKTCQRRVVTHIQGAEAVAVTRQTCQRRVVAHVQCGQAVAAAVQPGQVAETPHPVERLDPQIMHIDTGHRGDLILGEDAVAVGVEVLADIAAERVVGEAGLVDGHTLHRLRAGDKPYVGVEAEDVVLIPLFLIIPIVIDV